VTAHRPNTAARPSLGFFDADGEKAFGMGRLQIEQDDSYEG